MLVCDQPPNWPVIMTGPVLNGPLLDRTRPGVPPVDCSAWERALLDTDYQSIQGAGIIQS
tara:strand:+ start:2537 stop:2716 length:180 start_codon:yes stop_codon:yes gene_type:complete